ncbi:phosphoribosylglycinamide formyltransferase [Acinetobacter puyangensis]|uniref:Excinuclease n=1 Tax=Acinetobacter puyangensis TaxID=1096779 RepID=A0A240E3T7_9GAMM|nr:excinuclease [Acinetobacter puyangensis]SNX43252.1 hypothetical protein SAMN05421731_101287 [Acinetobacter puyangensis]
MLKKILLAAALTSVTVVANAKDEAHYFDFNQAVESAIAAGALDGSVKFYLAGTKSGGTVLQKDLISNKKTNGFAKTAENACDWALRSALIQFEKTAKAQGANAVTNIVSFYKRNEYKNTNKYECYKGTAVAAVTIKGDIVKF